MFENKPPLVFDSEKVPERREEQKSLPEQFKKKTQEEHTSLMKKFGDSKLAELAKMFVLGSLIMGAASGCAGNMAERLSSPAQIERLLHQEKTEKFKVTFSGIINGKGHFIVYKDEEDLEALREARLNAEGAKYGTYNSQGKSNHDERPLTSTEKMLTDDDQYSAMERAFYKVTIDSENVEITNIEYSRNNDVDITTEAGCFHFPSQLSMHSGFSLNEGPKFYATDKNQEYTILLDK